MRTCWEPVYSFLCHLWPYSLSPATVRGGRGVKCSSATRIQRVIGCDTCWSGRYYPGCSLFWSVRLRSVWPCWRAACYTGDWVQCRWHTRRRVWCESLSADNQTAAGSADAVLHLNFSVGRGCVTFLIFGCSRDETRVVFTMAWFANRTAIFWRNPHIFVILRRRVSTMTETSGHDEKQVF